MPVGQRDPAGVYRKLGVTPIISASGSVTRYGGTRTRPEVLEVMVDAASVMVEIEGWAEKRVK